MSLQTWMKWRKTSWTKVCSNNLQLKSYFYELKRNINTSLPFHRRPVGLNCVAVSLNLKAMYGDMESSISYIYMCMHTYHSTYLFLMEVLCIVDLLAEHDKFHDLKILVVVVFLSDNKFMIVHYDG